MTTVGGRLQFQENSPQIVDTDLSAELNSAVELLKPDLRPRLPQLVLEGNRATLRNLVGSVRLPRGNIVEVIPKTVGETNWTDAVVQLLEPNTRIAVTGSQQSQSSTRRNDLSTALALEYARRLETALRSEGPLLAYEQKHLVSHRLNGHLDVTKWVRIAALNPTSFPMSRDELTNLNDFARALSLVSGWLSRVAVDGDLVSRLRRLQTQVIPGSPVPTHLSPAVARRNLPAQWARYRPAWDIAVPLLRHRSAVGDPGRAIGLEIAVEPWPLLETALTRALRKITQSGEGWEFIPKGNYPLLSMNGNKQLGIEPDGLLFRNGTVASTFECKYTVPRRLPDEQHVYQALTAAAALDSPLAVLVYPGDQAVTYYDVTGFHSKPAQLVTMGLSLYSYRRSTGDMERAKKIIEVLANADTSHCRTSAKDENSP